MSEPDSERQRDDASIHDIEHYLSQAPVLLRVVEANETIEASRGGRLIVTSVELWTTLIVIRWATFGAEPVSVSDPRNTARIRRSFTLRDDLGNTYDYVGGGASSNSPDDVARFEIGHEIYHGPVGDRATTIVFHPDRARSDDPVAIDITATL